MKDRIVQSLPGLRRAASQVSNHSTATLPPPSRTLCTYVPTAIQLARARFRSARPVKVIELRIRHSKLQTTRTVSWGLTFGLTFGPTNKNRRVS